MIPLAFEQLTGARYSRTLDAFERAQTRNPAQHLLPYSARVPMIEVGRSCAGMGLGDNKWICTDSLKDETKGASVSYSENSY